jgi:glycosyltransferase involved in cell wall biosynthesis
MLISVVIPTYNRREILSNLLSTIFQQDFPTTAYEVILVVDGSTDGSAQFLNSLKAPCAFRVIEQPNEGRSAARNIGARAATGRFILFLDDDMLCDRKLLTYHFESQSADRSLVFGPIFSASQDRSSVVGKWAHSNLDDYFAELEQKMTLWQPYHPCAGANCSLPRSVFLRSGGYDRSLSGEEDTELGLRLWKMGVVLRLSSRSSDEVVRKDSRGAGRKLMYVCRKHPDYRAYSKLGIIVSGYGLRRGIKELTARLPFSVDPVLSVLSWISESFSYFPSMAFVRNSFDRRPIKYDYLA